MPDPKDEVVFRPSPEDHEIFNVRKLKEPAESLPESTKEQIENKMDELAVVSDAIGEAADADMLGDKTDQSVINTYVGDGHKSQIAPIREKVLDPQLRSKKKRLDDEITRLNDLWTNYGKVIDGIIISNKQNAKEITNAYTSIERETVSAASYFKRLDASRRNKKGGRKAGKKSKKE